MSRQLKYEQNDYQTAKNNFDKGLENDVWNKGTLDQKRQFAADFFTARIEGTAQGKSVPVLSIDNSNNLTFGYEQHSLSRGERAMQVLNAPVMDSKSDNEFERC